MAARTRGIGRVLAAFGRRGVTVAGHAGRADHAKPAGCVAIIAGKRSVQAGQVAADGAVIEASRRE